MGGIIFSCKCINQDQETFLLPEKTSLKISQTSTNITEVDFFSKKKINKTPTIKISRNKLDLNNKLHINSPTKLIHIFSKHNNIHHDLDKMFIGKILSTTFQKRCLLVMSPIKNETNFKTYLLKIIQKIQTPRYIFTSSIEINCPFLVRTKFIYENKDEYLFLKEYLAGGKLEDIFLNKNYRIEPLISFFGAEIVLALEYLHKEIKIICGSLKPNNILLNSTGHLKISDYGVYYDDFNNEIDKETIEFLPPEAFLENKLCFASDFWSLGMVLLFFLTGKLPFCSEKTKIIKDEIKHGFVAVPKNLSEISFSLISGLLNKNPEKRLGYVDFNEIKNHKFFKLINWKLMSEVKLQSPLKLNQNKIKKEKPKENFMFQFVGTNSLL